MNTQSDYEGPAPRPARTFDIDSSTGQVVEVDAGEDQHERESPSPPERREPYDVRRARREAEAEAVRPTTLTTRRSASARERLKLIEGRVRDTESALETAEAKQVECRRAVSDSFGSEFSFANIEAAEAAELEADAEVKRLTERLELLRHHATEAQEAEAEREAGDLGDEELAALTTECWASLNHARETAQAVIEAHKRLVTARQTAHPHLGRRHEFIAELSYPLAQLEKASRLLQVYLDSPLTQPARLLR